MSVRVRFVLSGACHPSYSGRQLQLDVPFFQANGSPTTTADIKEMIRKNWPGDLSEMCDTISTTDMKILRTGNLLADNTQLRNILSPTETYDCSVSSSAAPRDGEEPKSVLMHLVFQKNRTAEKREKESNKASKGKKKDGGPSDNGCCRLM